MGSNDTSFNKENAAENGKKGGEISKRPPFDERVQAILEAIKTEDNPNNLSNEELLTQKLVELGLGGSVQAVKEVFNRAFGNAKQSIDHSISKEAPIDEVKADLARAFGKKVEEQKEGDS